MASKSFVSVLCFLIFLVATTANTQAHFVYIYGEDGKAIVVFGEDLAPGSGKVLIRSEIDESFLRSSMLSSERLSFWRRPTETRAGLKRL